MRHHARASRTSSWGRDRCFQIQSAAGDIASIFALCTFAVHERGDVRSANKGNQLEPKVHLDPVRRGSVLLGFPQHALFIRFLREFVKLRAKQKTVASSLEAGVARRCK